MREGEREKKEQGRAGGERRDERERVTRKERKREETPRAEREREEGSMREGYTIALHCRKQCERER